MKVTTTVNGASRYVCIDTEGYSCLNVLMKPEDKSPEAALRREAEDCRRTAARLLTRARAYEAGADLLQLSATA